MATPNGASPLRIDISTLPDISQPDMDILDSSFFQTGKSPRPQLPSPASIYQSTTEGRRTRGGVTRFEELHLAVKMSSPSNLTSILQEAQTMYAIRRLFLDGQVPVPELFGWRRYKERVFIYQSLVHGETMEDACYSLTEDGKLSLRNELAQITAALRSITQPSPNMIASVNGGSVQDSIFRHKCKTQGPFSDIKSFNDCFFEADAERDEDRTLLPDEGNIYFTHGSLLPHRIIVAPDEAGVVKIKAITHWHHSGWYPEYWEYCKMRCEMDIGHEWFVDDWPAQIVKPFEDTTLMFYAHFWSYD